MKLALQQVLLRPAEVAEICGVTRNTVYRWIRRAVFERVTLSGCTYIRGRDLRAHLNGGPSHCEEPEDGYEDELEQEAVEMLVSFRGHR